jgi:hypothetical protein
MSILFKNIAKKANDLLSDKNTSKKFSVATEAANGTKYNAEASISGASVSGKVGASLKHDSGFNVDKVEFDNKGTLTTNITLDKAVDNVQFSVNSKIQPLATTNPAESVTIGATYSSDDFQADLDVSPIDPTSADFSACFKRDDLYFGGAAGLKLTEDSGVDVSGYDFGVGYIKSSAAAAFTIKNKLADYQFSFFHQHSDKIAFAATIGGKTDNAGSAGLAFGGSYNVDDGTTANAKLSAPNGSASSANFSFNLDHRLNASAKLGLTAVIPADLTGAPAFGLNLSLGI